MGQPYKNIQSVFNRGELSPRVIGRVDNDAYYAATKYSVNFIPFPQGAITKRPGTVYVANVKNSANTTIFVPFRFSTVQNYAIELGDLYARFYRNRGQVQSGGVPYEIVTPWPSSILRELKFVQSFDRLYVFHKDYQPRVITRTSDTSWTIDLLAFEDGPFLPVNTTATTLSSTGTSGSVTITASAALFSSGDVGRQIRLRHGSGDWGWVTITGFTSSTSVSATVGKTLAGTGVMSSWALGYFGGSFGWPSVATIYEERLIMGATANYPATIFATTTGGFGANAIMSPSNANGTVVDDNGFVYTIGDDQVNNINWMSSGRILLLGTSGGEYSMTGGTSSSYAPVTPSNVTIKRESKTGSRSNVRAQRVGNAVLYVSRSGLKVRELAFEFGIDSYVSRDVTIFNNHITDTGIIDLDFQDEPDPTLWTVLDDGKLVGFSYERVQKVEGWHRHVLGGTNAKVRALCCIPRPSGFGDDLWMIVQRTINGATVQTIEYLSDEFASKNGKESAFFVDCGSTYDGYLQATLTPSATSGSGVTFTASTGVFLSSMVGDQIRSGTARATITGFTSATQVTATITSAFPSISAIPAGSWSVATDAVSGITWLQNETVTILADGAYAGEAVVTSGSVTLPVFASKVHIGLPYTAEVHTLPVEAQRFGTIAGNVRRASQIFIYLTDTIGMRVDNAINSNTEVPPFGGGTHPLDQGPELFTGILEVDSPTDFDREGIIEISHVWPTNITINYIAQEMSING